MKVCGNPQCKTSTGIHGGLTHGWGELDFNGFWEHTCEYCSRAEELYDERISYALKDLKCTVELIKNINGERYYTHPKDTQKIVDALNQIMSDLVY